MRTRASDTLQALVARLACDQYGAEPRAHRAPRRPVAATMAHHRRGVRSGDAVLQALDPYRPKPAH